MNIYSTKKLLTQLMREFSIPLICSIAWIFYKNGTINKIDAELIEKFTAAFFIFSWIFGQIFRVWKQNKNEKSLSLIENRFEEISNRMELRFSETVHKMEENYRKSIGNITGGDSYPSIIALQPIDDFLKIIISSKGEYPLFDVIVTINDLDNQAKREKILKAGDVEKFLSGDFRIRLETIKPDAGLLINTNFRHSSKEKNYSLNIDCRNGTFSCTLNIKTATSGKIQQKIEMKNKSGDVLT